MSPRSLAARPAPAHLPALTVIAVSWLALADLPTGWKLGPISVSGLATVIAGAAAVILAPALLLRGRGPSAPREWAFTVQPGPRRSVVPLPLVLFCAVAIVGLLRAPSANGVQQVAVYCAFAFAIGAAALHQRGDTARRTMELIGRVMGVVGIVSIPVFLAQAPLWSARSFALAALVAVAVLVPLQSGSPLVRIAPYALTVGIAASLSRTALAVAVLLLAFAVLRSRHGAQGLRIVLALLALAVATLVAFLDIPALRDRFTTGDNSFDIGGIALNTSGRSEIWSVVIQDAWKSPWVGHGAGTASDVITAKYPFIAQPHNDYLRLWHDFGFIGLGLFLLAMLLLFAGAVRRIRRAPREHRAIHWAAALAMLAVAAGALTDNPVIYPFVMIPLGVVIGLSVGRRDLDDPTERHPPRTRAATAPESASPAMVDDDQRAISAG